MNSAPRRPVPARIARMALVLTALCPGLHACDEANGGAVELSWSLEKLDGRPVGACGAIQRIRLYWEYEAGESTRGSEAWPCDDRSAVTRFSLPEGAARLWVVPVCAGGVDAAPSQFVAPAPLVRTIVPGELVTLNAVLITIVDPITVCASV